MRTALIACAIAIGSASLRHLACGANDGAAIPRLNQSLNSRSPAMPDCSVTTAIRGYYSDRLQAGVSGRIRLRSQVGLLSGQLELERSSVLFNGAAWRWIFTAATRRRSATSASMLA